MDKAARQSVNPVSRCHRAWPMVIIGLAVMAGSANVAAQQYIAERINQAYQEALTTPLPKAAAKQPIAKAVTAVKSPEREKEDLSDRKPRPINQPES